MDTITKEQFETLEWSDTAIGLRHEERDETDPTAVAQFSKDKKWVNLQFFQNHIMTKTPLQGLINGLQTICDMLEVNDVIKV